MKYSVLAEFYSKLEAATKRLEKTWMISRLFKKTSEENIERIVLLVQGRVFPLWDETKIGVSDRLVIKAISLASGANTELVENEWKKTGDLGLVCEKLIEKKSQATLFSKDVTVEKVFGNIRSLASAEGEGSVDLKVKMVAELLSSAKPLEAKYIVRTVLEDLRVGVGAGIIRDAIAWAFFEDEARIHYDETQKSITPEDRDEYNKLISLVQRAFDLKADFSIVAKLVMSKGVKAFKDLDLTVFNPVNAMLFQKAVSLSDAFKRVGKPCAFEYKYDGFRMQIHKGKDNVKIFTRRLEEVTNQFPEVKSFVFEQVKARECILDGEAVGFDPKTGKYKPFQQISQRIRRKYDVDKLARELPVEVHLFDILLLDGKNLLDLPYLERRKILNGVVGEKKHMLVLAKQVVTSDLVLAQEFYDEALRQGQEGVMAKNLEGKYQPGSRVGFGVKVKPLMDSLDTVITGAEWGTGKRKGWLTSFTIACKHKDDFLEIGRVGTGLKELSEQGASFKDLTELLKPLIRSESGTSISVKPKIIIEVSFEEIQKSPSYSSGFALRFPRFVRLRIDKGLSDVSDLEVVREQFNSQAKHS